MLLANAGFPTIAFYWPVAWLAFPLVVALEAWVARATSDMTWKEAGRLAFDANIASTLVGIPLAWVGLAVLMFGASILTHSWPPPLPGFIGPGTESFLDAVLTAPWLAMRDSDYSWGVHVASAALCVPFFAVSFLIERSVARTSRDRKWAGSWSLKSNALTYGTSVVVFLALAWRAYSGTS